MSTLEALAVGAPRYNPRKRSLSIKSSSSSGYGSIVSDSEEDQKSLEDVEQAPSRSDAAKGKVEDGEYQRLDMNNKGMKLLLKMGWTEGSGLGAMNHGRKDPIPTPAQTPLLGLGKVTQDMYMLANSVSKPKELESLVIARESEEARLKREDKVKVVQEREGQREDRLKTFHCATCDKGYTNITQFEEHERSYAHHHARRALEAKQARKVGNGPAEARREKERKREEKELKRMAMAAGVNVGALSSVVEAPGGDTVVKKPGSGWAPISTVNPEPKFKASGFAPISSRQANQDAPKSFQSFKPIGSTFPPPSQLEPPPPPRFVISSSAATSFQSSVTDHHADNSLKPDDADPPKSSESAPLSKFAQIAARLAAKRAAGEAIGSSANKMGSMHCSKTTDLERMLEDGF